MTDISGSILLKNCRLSKLIASVKTFALEVLKKELTSWFLIFNKYLTTSWKERKRKINWAAFLNLKRRLSSLDNFSFDLKTNKLELIYIWRTGARLINNVVTPMTREWLIMNFNSMFNSPQTKSSHLSCKTN